MPNQLTTTNYKPELDGLRALALTFVILEHSFGSLFQGGFVGVDLFFVLSGYLITSILTKELQNTGSIHLGEFYTRRFLRLTPALLTMLSVYAAGMLTYAWWVNKPELGELHSLATAIAATYTMNWVLAFDLAPPGFLEHTWSLGIEEQFYLAWPLLLLAACRLLTRRQLALACLVLILACNGWRAVLWATSVATPPLGEHRIYMGLDTRADGLLVGCLLALTPPARRVAEMLARYAVVPVTALLGALAFMQWGSAAYKLGSGLVALSAGWVIVAVLATPAQPGLAGWLARLLRLRPVTYLGRISYGCYLWHFPVLLTLGWFLPGDPSSGSGAIRAALAVTFAFSAAALSYHWIELPMRLRHSSRTGPDHQGSTRARAPRELV